MEAETDNGNIRHLVDEIRRESIDFRKEFESQKEFASLRAETRLELSYFKWIGVIIGIILAFLASTE